MSRLRAAIVRTVSVGCIFIALACGSDDAAPGGSSGTSGSTPDAAAAGRGGSGGTGGGGGVGGRGGSNGPGGASSGGNAGRDAGNAGTSGSAGAAGGPEGGAGTGGDGGIDDGGPSDPQDASLDTAVDGADVSIDGSGPVDGASPMPARTTCLTTSSVKEVRRRAAEFVPISERTSTIAARAAPSAARRKCVPAAANVRKGKRTAAAPA